MLLGGEEDLEELDEDDDDRDCSILDGLYSFLMMMAVGSDMMESDGTGGGANCGTGGGGGGGGWSRGGGELGIDIGSRLIPDMVGDGVVVVVAAEWRSSSCWNESGSGLSDGISRCACEI